MDFSEEVNFEEKSDGGPQNVLLNTSPATFCDWDPRTQIETRYHAGLGRLLMAFLHLRVHNTWKLFEWMGKLCLQSTFWAIGPIALGLWF